MDSVDVKTHFVSVVIPAFNAESSIGDCIDALFDQSFDPERLEIIIVDDGSTDKTADIAMSRNVKLYRQENQGPAIARNNGVQHALGDIILFTDSDCIATRNFIEEMVRPFSDPMVVGVKGAYKTKQTGVWARFAQVEFEERYCKLARSRSIDFVDSHAAAFRKDIFLEVGGFDPHFPVANNEDVDLSYKIARLGYPMVFNPKALIYHYHPDSGSKYLRLKFLRAYWRMQVYRRFPEKVLSDSYTPQTLKLQIVAVALVLMTLALGIVWPVLFKTIPYLLVFFGLTIIPFMLKAARTDLGILWFCPLAIVLRSLVFGFGVVGGMLAQHRRNLLIPMMYIVSDLAAFTAAYLGAFWIRSGVISPLLKPFDHTMNLYLSLYPLVLGVWGLAGYSLGLYRSGSIESGVREFARVTKSVSFSLLTIVTISFFWKWDYSRAFIVLFWIFAVFSLNITRVVVRSFRLRIQKKGFQTIRTVIVGTGDTGRLVCRRLQESGPIGVRIVGVVDNSASLGESHDWDGVQYLGNIDDLEKIIRSNSIDDVFIAKPDMSHTEILDLVVRCEKTGAGFKIVSDLMNIVTGRAGLSPVSGLPFVDLKEERHDFGRRMVKRIMDLVLGSILLVLLLPIKMVIALVVHLTMPGSILVEEERVGKNGRLFKMLRFRVKATSDYSDDNEPEGIVGRFLQKSHLEEFPQILNVIRGDMSLVGPRPEVPEIVATYEDWQRKRLEVPPGITGLWQIMGPSQRPLHEDLEYDFFYIKNYDLWMDLSLLLQTIPIVCFGRRDSIQ